MEGGADLVSPLVESCPQASELFTDGTQSVGLEAGGERVKGSQRQLTADCSPLPIKVAGMRRFPQQPEFQQPEFETHHPGSMSHTCDECWTRTPRRVNRRSELDPVSGCRLSEL